ncbi:sushi domain-containing protein 3 isoform X2 [Arapaima gigas]
MSTATASMADVSRTVLAADNENRAVNRTGQCRPMAQPPLGVLTIVRGNGTDVGTRISVQCPSKHRLVGDSVVSCEWSSNSAQWSGGLPSCKPLSRFEDFGFRVAVIASIVSCAIILLMSVAFLTCCLLKCIRKQERRRLERETQLWQQLEHEDVEEIQTSYYGYKGRNNNNNTRKQKAVAERHRDPGAFGKRGSYRYHREYPHVAEDFVFGPAPLAYADHQHLCGLRPPYQALPQTFIPAGRDISVVSGLYVGDPYRNLGGTIYTQARPSPIVPV